MIKQRNVTIKTATATITVGEMGDILCNSAIAQTYTLPAVSLGLWYRFSNINVGVVTILNGATIATIAQNEQRLLLNNGSSWYVFRDRVSIPFKDLSDVPADYISAGSKFVKVKADATGLEFVVGEAIASAFTDLTDAPGSYVGNAEKIVAVNIAENALEFIDAPSGGGLVINPNHIFVDTTARDSYFTTNPIELVTSIYISVGTGFQQWDGTVWQDKTAVVIGPQGIQGVGVTKQWINFWTGLPVVGSSAQLSKAAYIVPQQEIKLSGVSSCVDEAAGKTFKFTVCELNSSGVQQGEALYDSGNIVSLGKLNYTRKMTSELTLEVGKYYVVSLTNTTSGGIFAKTSIASNNIKDVISGISGFATYNGNPADGVTWAITAGTTTLAFGMLIEI